MSSQDDINQNWQKIENDVKAKLIKFLQSDEETISLDINNTIEPHIESTNDDTRLNASSDIFFYPCGQLLLTDHMLSSRCGLKSKMHVTRVWPKKQNARHSND
ncbi:hypothetical protein Glove_58g100 [Diversispora epigaea]|uniref:Uncharacterized protein n=1 Tax=Diversispora epigaea TaxID=1348612 RepID=A0A397JEB2_9GLOM|nr:hypothetical protein Glove_58g100 [Diversispora epigaea]